MNEMVGTIGSAQATGVGQESLEAARGNWSEQRGGRLVSRRVSGAAKATLLMLSLSAEYFGPAPLGVDAIDELEGRFKDLAVPPQWWPNPITFVHYLNVFNGNPVGTWFENTGLITVLTVIGATTSSSLVAYGFALGRGLLERTSCSGCSCRR